MAEYKAIRGHTIRTVAGDPDPLLAGDIWYSSSTKKIRGAKLPAGAWSSGGNLNTGRAGGVGFGIQTAAIFAGGIAQPPNTNLDVVEQYDGSSWTEIADINTARRELGDAGTTAAGLIFNGIGASPINAGSIITEKWNGTSWTEVGDTNTVGYQNAGTGTSTAANKLCKSNCRINLSLSSFI